MIGGVSVSGKVIGWLLDAIKLIADFTIETLPSKLCSPYSQIGGRDPAAFKMASFAGDQLPSCNRSWNIGDDWVQVAIWFWGSTIAP